MSAAAALLACGPEFPLQFLNRREEVLLQAPELRFADEVRQLLPSPEAKFEAVETEADMETAEAEGLTAKAIQQIKSIRQAPDADAAFELGEGLPVDVRRYTAGAVGFHNRQEYAAREHFEAVVALPAAQRQRRGTWAHFMLGRLAAARGDVDAAAAHFRTTRELVRGGASDRLGLAVGSFGEEARLYLGAGGIARAVRLYAQQATYGSATAVRSLGDVADQVFADDQLLDEGIRDDLTRRLLFLYLQANGPEWHASDRWTADESESPTPRDRFDQKTWLERLTAALERHQITDAAGSGWLAAAAYEAGRFDLADRLAQREETVLSKWVRAKLASRQGDTRAALKHYRDAMSAFREAGTNDRAAGRLQAEAALLEVGRDEFAQALDMFFVSASERWPESASPWDAEYWWDAAYLAERVLTLDELKAHVDTRVKAPTASAMEEALERGGTLPTAALRGVLARRLMRTGRHDEAIGYFDNEHIRSVAEEYVSTMHSAQSRWRGRVARAEAWYSAATIARFDGMELLGLELSPDYGVVGGQFPLDDWRDQDEGEDAEIPEDTGTTGAQGARAAEPDDTSTTTDEAPPASFGPTEVEQQRVTGSAPAPNLRFHYRLTAVDHAMRAADLLPNSSQAFAAVLCNATGWIADREPQRAAAVYARYVREGPYVRWARSFGRQCPQPDFKAASRRAWAVRFDGAFGLVRSHPLAAGLVGVILAGFAFSARMLYRKYRERRATRTVAA